MTATADEGQTVTHGPGRTPLQMFADGLPNAG